MNRREVESIVLEPADWSTLCAECRHPRATHGLSGTYCTWEDRTFGQCRCQGFRPAGADRLPPFPLVEPRPGEAMLLSLPSGQLAAVRPMALGTTMLSVDYPPAHPLARAAGGRVYWDGWKYSNVPAAAAAACRWRRLLALGREALEPMGWTEHPASGRRP